MCSQWGESGSAKYYDRQTLYEHLEKETIHSLIDDLSSWKPTITLFGGEPMMYRGVFDLVRYIKSAGMRCNMITNGVMLEHFAYEIIDSAVDEIIWSLDGPEEIHDSIRGRRGTFQKAVKGIKKLTEIRNNHAQNKPVVNINSTIFETNYLLLRDTIKAVEELDIKTLTFHHLIFLSRSQYLEHNSDFNKYYGVSCTDWEGFILDDLPKIDPQRLLNNIRTIEKDSFRIPVHFYPNFTDEEILRYYSEFNFEPSSYKSRCLSAWMVAYIMPDGDVRPCYLFNLSLGNIKEKQFTEIWREGRYREFRRVTKTLGKYPACQRCTELYRF